MFSKHFSKKRHVSFWQWMQEHEADMYALLSRNPEEAVRTISRWYLKDYKECSFEISPVKENGKMQLMISANGERSKFPLIQKIVEAAPVLQKFDVVAFRQRKVPDDIRTVELALSGVMIKAEDVYFHSRKENQMLHITVHIEHFDGSKEYKIGGFILLDALLGEYDVETYLGNIEFRPLEQKDMFNLDPIWKLPQMVDAMKVS